MSKACLLLREQWVDDCVDTSVDESLEDSKGYTQQGYGMVLFEDPNSFSSLGITTITALLQILGILSWRMQELRKSQNQDLRADLVWSMNSGKMESNPRDIPGFRYLRAAASSSGLPSGVGIFHRSDSSLLTSLVDLRTPVLFFTSCEAMEFAETGHWWKERTDMPVSLLMVLHSLRQECEKSMELTASSHRSCFFCPSQDCRDEAALSESFSTGARVRGR